MRIAAIANENESSNLEQIAAKVVESGAFDKVIVFRKEKLGEANVQGVDFVRVSNDKDTTPKFRNFMLRHCRENFKESFLHVIDDSIEILENPTKFANDIEHLMSVLDINNFFGTITDHCNRVYKKYNPRLKIAIDRPEYQNLGFGDQILFCSHSNIQWIVYNMSKADDNELFFDEKFTVDMFFIIEFLARRRNSHPGSLYYMNQYVTCASEQGLYKFKEGLKREPRKDLQEIMKAEDAEFRARGINFTPDNNIDIILENVYLKMKAKV